jgi:hypothetical protein
VHRVLRRNSEYLHGECWSLSNQEAQSFLGHQRNVIHQCYMPSGESLCDLVAAGAVCYSRVARNGEYLHGDYWCQHQEPTKLAWVIKGML